MGPIDKRYEAELLIALERAVTRMNRMAEIINAVPSEQRNNEIYLLYEDAGAYLRQVNSDRNREGKEDPSKETKDVT
jgi:hypothetical protein